VTFIFAKAFVLRILGFCIEKEIKIMETVSAKL